MNRPRDIVLILAADHIGNHNIRSYCDAVKQRNQQIYQRRRSADGCQSVSATELSNNYGIGCVERNLKRIACDQWKGEEKQILEQWSVYHIHRFRFTHNPLLFSQTRTRLYQTQNKMEPQRNSSQQLHSYLLCQ